MQQSVFAVTRPIARSRSRGFRAGEPRLLLVTLLLAALIVQSLLVQAHRHAATRSLVPPHAGTATIGAADETAAADTVCPLCAHLARTAHYLGSAAVTLPCRVARSFWLVPGWGSAAEPELPAAHGWRSRGPPPAPTNQR